MVSFLIVEFAVFNKDLLFIVVLLKLKNPLVEYEVLESMLILILPSNKLNIVCEFIPF